MGMRVSGIINRFKVGSWQTGLEWTKWVLILQVRWESDIQACFDGVGE